MPYISYPARREAIDSGAIPETEGELNYAFTKLIIKYLEHNGLSYDRLGDVTGAAYNAVDEMRRRLQHPYEDGKILANGDVYPDSLLSQVAKPKESS